MNNIISHQKSGFELISWTCGLMVFVDFPLWEIKHLGIDEHV